MMTRTDPIVMSAAEMLYESLHDYSGIILRDSVIRIRWADASEDLRRQAYESVFRMMRNPAMTVEENHAMYVCDAVFNGWILGETYDPVRKISPRLKPFDAMTHDQKALSDLAISVFRVFAGKLGCTEENCTVVNNFNGTVRCLIQNFQVHRRRKG